MNVKVLRTAFYDGALVEPGTVLEVPNGFKSLWAAPVDSPAAKAVKPARVEREKPRALSEAEAPKTFVEAHKGDLA